MISISSGFILKRSIHLKNHRDSIDKGSYRLPMRLHAIQPQNVNEDKSSRIVDEAFYPTTLEKWVQVFSGFIQIALLSFIFLFLNMRIDKLETKIDSKFEILQQVLKEMQKQNQEDRKTSLDLMIQYFGRTDERIDNIRDKMIK